MRKLSPAERYARLAADPELRRRLLETPADGGSRAFMAQSFHKMFPVGERPDYEPDARELGRRHRPAQPAARRRRSRSKR